MLYTFKLKVWPTLSLQTHLCTLTTELQDKNEGLPLTFIAVTSHDFLPCLCSDGCNFGHFNLSCYLLTYLLTYL